MTGIKKTFKKITSKETLKKRFTPLTPKSTKKEVRGSFISNPLRVIDESVEDVGDAFTPEIPVPEEQPVLPIPDEALQANESRRRRSRRSRTGRQSTILTGLGG